MSILGGSASVISRQWLLVRQEVFDLWPYRQESNSYPDLRNLASSPGLPRPNSPLWIKLKFRSGEAWGRG